MRKFILIPSALAIAACVAGAGLATAQSAPPPPPPPPHHGWGWGGPDGPGEHRHGRGMRGPDRAMKLAARLSAMETLIGIRADQLDAWRAFTAAAVDLVQRPPRRDANPEARPGEPRDLPPFELADRMADEAIARGEKAKALKEAVSTLRQKLTPEQLERVKTVESDLRGRWMRGHDGMRGPKPGGPEGPRPPERQRL